jgi:ribosomal protein S27AE
MTKPTATATTTEANTTAPTEVLTETIHTCPRCGATVVLLIAATAWHLPCGRRMTPATPTARPPPSALHGIHSPRIRNRPPSHPPR